MKIRNTNMEYNIGDILLVKSKIIPFESCESEISVRIRDANWVNVRNSTSAGYDVFIKSLCPVIKNGYVEHTVVVTDYDIDEDGSIKYHTRNDISKTGYGWQIVDKEDIIKCIGRMNAFEMKEKYDIDLISAEQKWKCEKNDAYEDNALESEDMER